MQAFELQQITDWRRWMGIEPTWDFVEPHAGFEDQRMHQQSNHLHINELQLKYTLILMLQPRQD